jgi:hypothetical protein
LVTVDSEVLLAYIHENVYKQWVTNPFGVVVDVEGYMDGRTTLVKIHFESLRNAYWLYASEVLLVNPPTLEDK